MARRTAAGLAGRRNRARILQRRSSASGSLLGDGIAGADDADEYLLCHDRNDGRRLWATRTGPAWNRGSTNWQSSRSTPTVDPDGGRVYVLTAQGELICCDASSGDEIWRKSMQQDFGGQKADGWGYSESVLIDGDRLICTPGGSRDDRPGQAIGRPVWTAVRDGYRGSGIASMVNSEIGGVRVYVQTTGRGALGVRASDGRLLWSYPIDRTTAVAPTPIVREDLVFFTAGYRRGGALLRQQPDGQGGVKIEEVYPLNTQLANKHGGVVLVGDHLYGDTDDAASLPLVRHRRVLWKKRGSGRHSIAIAAATAVCTLRQRTMVLPKADPDDFVGRQLQFLQRTPHGPIRDRRRQALPAGADAIACFDVRDGTAAASR